MRDDGSYHQVRCFICALSPVVNVKNFAMCDIGRLYVCVCVFAYVCVCVFVCARWTVIVMVEVGVASLCGTRSREQVGSGWSRESVLIVFVPQSCLAVVKAASTSWEANCSIYTGRRFLFLKPIYLFIYVTMGDVSTIYRARGLSLHFIHTLSQTAKIKDRQLWWERQSGAEVVRAIHTDREE